MNAVVTTLKPRKTPVQVRSAATVETLHMAAIQVLLQEGLSRCTTTRIAERAGMSVGSLYQYYPNRDALLAGVLEKHLEGIAGAVERACHEHRGKQLSQMGSAFVVAFLAAKLRDPREAKALYAVAEERGGAVLAARMRSRIEAAVAAMLASAPDAQFDDPAMVAKIALGALVGAGPNFSQRTCAGPIQGAPRKGTPPACDGVSPSPSVQARAPQQPAAIT